MTGIVQPPTVDIEHDGGDQLWYLPAGANPVPACLTEDDDLGEVITSARERAVVIALLRLALRRMGFEEALPAAPLPATESRRVDELILNLRQQLVRQHELIVRLTGGSQ